MSFEKDLLFLLIQTKLSENHWWARRELNSRSSPCQGDVITPRPRALQIKRIGACIKPHR